MHTSVLRGGALPARLKDLREPPTELYVHGDWPVGPVVCVVGTRIPSRAGAQFTHELCCQLAREGVVVASGGAEGIDTAAHEGAHEGGATLVVAPAGFERPFPEGNAELFRRIAEGGGAYVSEHAPREPAKRHVFFRRNALLVALSDLVIVAESPFRSGARNAAHWARRLGRPAFVVPHSPWNGRGGGWLEEHRLGAGLVLGPRDVLRALRRLNLHTLGGPDRAAGRQLALALRSESAPRQEPSTRGPAEPLRAVLAALLAGPLHIDDLVERAQLPVASVQSVVAELSLDERVKVSALGVVSLLGSKGLPTDESAR
jgi:DNA processing protein